MDNSIAVLQRNLQLLMIEIFKAKYCLKRSFIKQIFEEKVFPNNLRWSDKLHLTKVKKLDLKRLNLWIKQEVWKTIPPELKNVKPATADYAEFLVRFLELL